VEADDRGAGAGDEDKEEINSHKGKRKYHR